MWGYDTNNKQNALHNRINMKAETKQKYDVRLANVRNDLMRAMQADDCVDKDGWNELFEQYKITLYMLMEERGGTIAISNAIQTLEGRVYRKVNNITDEAAVALSGDSTVPTPEQLIEELDVDETLTYENMMQNLGDAMSLIMGVYSWAVKRNPLAAEVDVIKSMKMRADDIRVTMLAFSKVGSRV